MYSVLNTSRVSWTLRADQNCLCCHLFFLILFLLEYSVVSISSVHHSNIVIHIYAFFFSYCLRSYFNMDVDAYTFLSKHCFSLWSLSRSGPCTPLVYPSRFRSLSSQPPGPTALGRVLLHCLFSVYLCYTSNCSVIFFLMLASWSDECFLTCSSAGFPLFGQCAPYGLLQALSMATEFFFGKAYLYPGQKPHVLHRTCGWG